MRDAVGQGVVLICNAVLAALPGGLALAGVMDVTVVDGADVARGLWRIEDC